MVNNQITMTNFSFLLLLLLLSNLLHPSSASRTGPTSHLASLPSLKSFNVLDYGAKGDGESDCTAAFSKAWNDACSSSGEVQIYVPKGDYMLQHLSFEGGCKTSNIVFLIDGTLFATGIFKTFSWILFHKVDGLHIKGGVLDAKGQSLWECKNAHKQCPNGAMSLSFDNSKNIVVEGLTSKDSQMYHITINDCQNVKLVGVSISADGNSPNTDGTHIEGSQGVTIMQSSYQTGDDCISIGPNNQNIWVEDVHCGPGHGISIGSLGKQGSSDNVQVRNVTVKSTVFTGSDNGLRIKTWASPIEGVVQDIFYLGAQMNNVKNPIIIDQHYCPNSDNCPSSSQASNIQLKNIVYKDIQGTSSIPVAITFDCSSKSPCEGLTLQDIKLSYNSKIAKSECENAYGKSTGLVQPSSCLS